MTQSETRVEIAADFIVRRFSKMAENLNKIAVKRDPKDPWIAGMKDGIQIAMADLLLTMFDITEPPKLFGEDK